MKGMAKIGCYVMAELSIIARTFAHGHEITAPSGLACHVSKRLCPAVEYGQPQMDPWVASSFGTIVCKGMAK